LLPHESEAPQWATTHSPSAVGIRCGAPIAEQSPTLNVVDAFDAAIDVVYSWLKTSAAQAQDPQKNLYTHLRKINHQVRFVPRTITAQSSVFRRK
jgi:hypothetical protein